MPAFSPLIEHLQQFAAADDVTTTELPPLSVTSDTDTLEELVVSSNNADAYEQVGVTDYGY